MENAEKTKALEAQALKIVKTLQAMTAEVGMMGLAGYSTPVHNREMVMLIVLNQTARLAADLETFETMWLSDENG